MKKDVCKSERYYELQQYAYVPSCTDSVIASTGVCAMAGVEVGSEAPIGVEVGTDRRTAVSGVFFVERKENNSLLSRLDSASGSSV